MPEMPAVLISDQTVETSINSQLYLLGAWVAGLDSFLSGGGASFGDRHTPGTARDYIRELRLARAALQKCSRLTFTILSSDTSSGVMAGIRAEELHQFASALRDPLMLAESLNRSESLDLTEWNAWCKVFLERFADVPAYSKLIALTESGGDEYLPALLRDTIYGSLDRYRPEYEAILPRFGQILRLLEIVGKMLAADEPLKPALLIFARINEMIQDLISYLNHRVERSADQTDEFTGSLDGAAYMASLELKKVVQQELAGLTIVRPATTVYARTEAAHALLTESFQQILTGFARQIDPKTDALALFPNFEVKLERSLKLRQEIYDVLKLVQRAEADPEKSNISVLNNALLSYMDETVHFLFYKDTETIERFVEEILVTNQKKDLVPILHRFGAYLETLFAQVNMRAVLEKHPFAVRV
ncbi:MAG: hypothetical protein KA746_08770 [Pyrinomonadaceae bacterium]|nr:hypothetical protein [Pyrinomonadaceae bacterium]MBP6212458.1 hypothetical protein [Pyrinomonadaceae bacterium]